MTAARRVMAARAPADARTTAPAGAAAVGDLAAVDVREPDEAEAHAAEVVGPRAVPEAGRPAGPPVVATSVATAGPHAPRPRPSAGPSR
jgi:hypothetical protein